MGVRDPSCRNNSRIARSLLNGAWEQHKCAPATTVMHVRHQCGRLNTEATASTMSRFTFRASDGWLSANCEGIADATDVNSMCHGFNRLYLFRLLLVPPLMGQDDLQKEIDQVVGLQRVCEVVV